VCESLGVGQSPSLNRNRCAGRTCVLASRFQRTPNAGFGEKWAGITLVVPARCFTQIAFPDCITQTPSTALPRLLSQIALPRLRARCFTQTAIPRLLYQTSEQAEPPYLVLRRILLHDSDQINQNPMLTYLSDNSDVLINAAWRTIQLALLTFFFGLIVGMFLVICKVSPLRPARSFAGFITKAMVNTPVTFLMFFGFYGIPKLGVLVSGFATAVVMMSIYNGAYISEALRAGINTVPNGQAEAARAIGLTFGQTVRHIVLPQAFRSSFGPLGFLLNANFRNVAVAGAIGVGELVKTQRVLGEGINPATGENLAYAKPFPFSMAAFAFYLVVGLSLGAIATRLDKKLAVKR
jgi:glutamate transport system permease protein